MCGCMKKCYVFPEYKVNKIKLLIYYFLIIGNWPIVGIFSPYHMHSNGTRFGDRKCYEATEGCLKNGFKECFEMSHEHWKKFKRKIYLRPIRLNCCSIF